MEILLKHLANMTGQRDQALLDQALLLALQGSLGICRARVLELVSVRHETRLQPTAWLADGVAALAGEGAAGDSEPLSAYPALMLGLRTKREAINDVLPDGDSVLWLPLRMHEETVGCVEIRSMHALAPEARQSALGIVAVYLNHRNLLDYSEHDSLTGLLNRKTFDDRFSRLLASGLPAPALDAGEQRRHPDASKSHWLGVVDIDHFKRVNDQFGHLYGDEVLILVANLLRNSFRAQDRVFRFGGEEFVVLLRSAILEEARGSFERFRQKVEQHPFPQVGRITVSLGFTRITNESPVQILGHADQALYHAKTHGRNRVCHYEELVQAGLLKQEASQDMVEFF